jgi:pimeloyl-[acyl-carrier protein] synthase
MTAIGINMSRPEFLTDPYPVYRQLRASNGPLWFPTGGPHDGVWLVARYDDVAAILKEQHTSKDSSRMMPIERQGPLMQTMLFRDPPDHTRLRALASQSFTPGRIRNLEPRITQIADELLSRAQPNGRMDFMAEFAMPLPVIVIAELLGVPLEDRAMFRAASNRIIGTNDDSDDLATAGSQQRDASMTLAGYFRELISQRRQAPRDDLISALTQARDAQDRLSEQELLGMCMLLLIAGHETTVNLLGNGLYTLLRHPDQFEWLKAHPDGIPVAVEEMLRFESPVQSATFRIVTDTVELGGKTLTKDQQVSPIIGAANRDPDQFPDPDRFDVTRQPDRHLAFGLGLHFCLGAPLARVEGRIGFTRLLERLPGTRLVDQTPDWNQNSFIRGLRHLPVTF